MWETTVSDTEFKAKPLTPKERLRMNLTIAIAVSAVLVMGGVMMHYHVDQNPTYATAPDDEPMAKKL